MYSNHILHGTLSCKLFIEKKLSAEEILLTLHDEWCQYQPEMVNCKEGKNQELDNGMIIYTLHCEIICNYKTTST